MKLKQFFGFITASLLSLTSDSTARAQTQEPTTKKGNTTMSNAALNETNTAAVEITPGLTYQQTQPGNGEKPTEGDMVSVHYKGTLASDGSEFDNSFKRGQPIDFKLGVGQVIKGWDLGIAHLSKGEKGTLTISPELGYGEHGAGGVIPGNATLVFEVELVDFKK